MAMITFEKALAAAGVGLIDLAGEKYLSGKEFAGIKGSDALRSVSYTHLTLPTTPYV